jgi:iron transport multicopper oxidase
MKRLTPHFLLTTLAAVVLAHTAHAVQVGRDADLRRTGWYPDQAGLSPASVSSSAFGQRFNTAVTGAVYAQPLVFGNTLLVVTEANWIYGLDPASGVVKWSRQVDTPWNASDIPCPDLTPLSGITATPVIDDATGIAYFTSKTYVSGSSGTARWKMHAVSMTTGAEQAGFPVTLSGNANNASGQTFSAATHNQRTGLLLLNGVVYAAFASVCDTPPFQGWIFGVSTAGAVTARWVDCTPNGSSGGGIWMSGSALVSDAAGQLLFTSGNGMNVGTPTTPAAGASPPASVCQSVVRLKVLANGTLQAIDFFTPTNASTVLDPLDGDLGSGGLVGLPSAPFGTATYPNPYLQIGKAGILYMLDGNALGGYQQGAGGTDAVLQELGPYGGVWSKPAVWGGDGGWVYLPTAAPTFPSEDEYGFLLAFHAGVDGTGKPTLNYVATTADTFFFGSSAPVVTSDASNSGSAMLWIVWCPDLTGLGAELRGYDVLPVSGLLHKRFSAPISQATKFNPPGVYNNRLYVGGRDGHVYGFGVSAGAGVDGNGLPRTRLGAAYPNPFVGGTALELALARDGTARLTVYDVNGRRVRSLVDATLAAGSRRVAWDGRDDAGAPAPAGLYLVRLESAGETHSRRVMLVR